jgi:hypothetical protein
MKDITNFDLYNTLWNLDVTEIIDELDNSSLSEVLGEDILAILDEEIANLEKLTTILKSFKESK